MNTADRRIAEVSEEQQRREQDLVDRVVRSFDECPDPRLRYVMQALVRHLHAYLREVRLTEDEWERAIAFLTDAGHITDDKRQEFILLSDVLGAVLRALRDRLPPGLAAHLSAELPLLVRGAYFDQWRPGEETLKLRSLAEFLERVSAGLAHGKPIGSLDATRAVFAVLTRHLDPGQVEKVSHALPADLRAFWPKREIAEPLI